MAPNLLVLMLSCVPSRRWFAKSNQSSRSSSRAGDYTANETRSTPVPGIYKRGKDHTWYLVATQDPETGKKTKLFEPREVAYCKLLHKWMFADEIASRTAWGILPSTPTRRGSIDKAVGFFRLDDKVTWVNHLDANGNFINAGGHARFCLVDKDKGVFRPMLRGDDPVWCASKRATPRSGLSRRGSSYMTSGTMTATDRASEKGDAQIDAKKLRNELQKLEHDDESKTQQVERTSTAVK